MRRVIILARAVALILLVTASGYSLLRWTWEPLRCARAASLGGELLNAPVQGRGYEASVLAGRIRADLEGCECMAAPDVAIPFTRGVAAEMTDDPRSAIDEYERALLIDRRPEIYFHLGMAQLATLDRSAAIASLTRACAFAPALLSDIPYRDVRREIRLRLNAAYAPDWVN